MIKIERRMLMSSSLQTVTPDLSEYDVTVIEREINDSNFGPVVRRIISDLLMGGNDGVVLEDYHQGKFRNLHLINNFLRYKKLPYEMRATRNSSQYFKLFVITKREVQT